MKVIGNLKRIARRPSLLLLNNGNNKGNSNNSSHTNTSGSSPIDDKSENDDDDTGLLFSERNNPLGHRPTTPILHTQQLTTNNVYGYELAEPTSRHQKQVLSIPPRRGGSRRRRASLGGGMIRPAQPLSIESKSTVTSSRSNNNNSNPMGLSPEQAERIQRAKNRHRNSTTTMMSSSSDHASSSALHPTTKNLRKTIDTHNNEQIHEVSSSAMTPRRRHSMDFHREEPSQNMTPLYIIRPDTFVTETPSILSKKAVIRRRNSLSKHISNTGSNHGKNPSPSDALSASSWHNMGRSVCTHQSTRSKESTKSRDSTKSKESVGSTFTSTGWTVASATSGNEDIRPKKAPTILQENGTSLGSRLYAMGREDSTKSLDHCLNLSSSEVSFGG